MAGAVRKIAVAAVVPLAMAGCGGGGEEDTTTPPTTAAGAEGATYDVTVGEFLQALEPEKTTMIADFVEDNPEECEGFEPKEAGDNVTSLSVKATETSSDTPLSELLLDYCTE